MNTATITIKLAKRLRELRKKNGYTQEKLAELSGVDYKHIQLLESKNPPAAKLDTIEKLAKAFKTDPSKLLKF
ncbi:MAG: helix-turn-helix transcriptional regulator [Candidatus Omnitrophica bacterium]|nr:helix-turn-helix transcriptional regulator [Candidatus Omnitrophota bacterium]